MNDRNLTDRELVHAVDNDPAATPRERELAERLHTLLEHIAGRVKEGEN